MTEVEWMTATDPRPMLDFIGAQASQRKLRIFAFACCRSVWEQLTREIQHEAIQVAERHADGNATDKELGIVVSAVHRQRRKHNTLDKAVYDTVRNYGGIHYSHCLSLTDAIARAAAGSLGLNPSPNELIYFDGNDTIREHPTPNADRLIWNETYARQLLLLSIVVRDIFGNPFRSVIPNPSWLTSTVLALANGIYNEKAFERMPILADALQDAGCDNEEILQHCRGPGPHVRGCFVVDLLLGKK